MCCDLRGWGLGTEKRKFGWEEDKQKFSYMEYSPQRQRGIHSRGLVRGEVGELLLPKKRREPLPSLCCPVSATTLSFSVSCLWPGLSRWVLCIVIKHILKEALATLCHFFLSSPAWPLFVSEFLWVALQCLPAEGPVFLWLCIKVGTVQPGSSSPHQNSKDKRPPPASASGNSAPPHAGQL